MRNIQALLMVAMLSGCGLLRHNQETAVKTLEAVATTVDHAMVAYADMRVAGKVDDATHAKVVALKLDYEKAMALAVAAVGGDMSRWAPDDVVKVSSDLVQLVLALAKEAK